jgi:hypothetical protein
MIRPVDETNYDIRHKGNPALHRPLRWYATEDDRVLGVVVLDLVDHDFGWVMMTENDQGPGFTAIDVAVSFPALPLATAALLTAMTQRAANG